jgi:tRNA dimethylallyltransferase
MVSRSPLAPPASEVPTVIAIFGPTASGKTAVAASLRERLGAEVVSADSAAIYEDLPILTAAPPYPARLVGVVAVTEEISVGAYQRLAHAAIDEIVAAGRIAIVAGGTGLYLRAALSSLELPPSPTAGVRERWEAAYAELGPEGAHALLTARDPAAAARVHANDRRRVVRALELAETGASLAPAADRLWTTDTRHHTILVGLELEDEVLDARIAERAHAMAAAGAPDEARRAWKRPLSATARKVMGLEAFATLPEDEAVREVIRANRRLARYQRKWLRRLPGVARLAGDRPAAVIADEILTLERTGEHLPRR